MYNLDSRGDNMTSSEKNQFRLFSSEEFFSGYPEVLKSIDEKINNALRIYLSDNKEEIIKGHKKGIENLKEHSSMWFRAGGMGGKMAMNAREEISYLEGIVRDLESGTTDFLSSLYEKKLEYLNLIKKGASIFQLKKIEALEKKSKEDMEANMQNIEERKSKTI